MQVGNGDRSLTIYDRSSTGGRAWEILFIAVGTPPLANGSSDTQYVEAVAKGIGKHLNGEYKVIVNKSTVPIGSGDWVQDAGTRWCRRA